MPLRLPRLSQWSSVSTKQHVGKPSSEIPQWRHTVRIFFTTLLYVSVIPLYITRNHYALNTATGQSMSPLLSPPSSSTADVLLIRKRVRLAEDPVAEGGDGKKGELRRGMVITFWKPTNKEPTLCVKRIVALEGDVVKPLKRRKMYDMNGRSTNEDVYAAQRQEEVTVPFGHVWVEGVNEDESIDSTEYGPISKSLITGIATKIWWPKARRGEIPWEEDWRRNCRRRVKIAKQNDSMPEDWAM